MRVFGEEVELIDKHREEKSGGKKKRREFDWDYMATMHSSLCVMMDTIKDGSLIATQCGAKKVGSLSPLLSRAIIVRFLSGSLLFL